MTGVFNLGEFGDLEDAGIACVRLWPQHIDMVDVARRFRDVLDGHADPESATAHLAGMIDWAPLAWGFYARREQA